MVEICGNYSLIERNERNKGNRITRYYFGPDNEWNVTYYRMTWRRGLRNRYRNIYIKKLMKARKRYKNAQN